MNMPEENPETAQIRKWLVKTTPKQDITKSGVVKSSANDNPSIKLKQMELDFARENAKMTDWIFKRLDMSEEVTPEKNLLEIQDCYRGWPAKP